MQTLKNAIATLEKLRDRYRDQLDASDLAELEDTLQQLKRREERGQGGIPLGELGTRVFVIMENIIKLVTNISDLMM